MNHALNFAITQFLLGLAFKLWLWHFNTNNRCQPFPDIIATQRNKLAPDFTPPLLESTNLIDWIEITPLDLTDEDLSPRLDLLKYEVENEPGSGKRFFSFEVPE